MKVLFSILKYRLITNESINIGILFHNLDTDERKFETITKWSRLKSFDDEINVRLFKIMLDGMKEEIQSNLFNDSIHFDMKEYISKFYNEMRFSTIYEGDTNDFKNFIEENKKIFLRYDYDKKSRPSRMEQISYMKKLMKANKIKYSVKKPMGKYFENINYDYIVENYAFKVFSFENRKLDNLINYAKAWAYTSKEMESTYRTIFVYDKDIQDTKFNIIIDILKTYKCNIIKYDDALEYILNNYKENKYDLLF